MLEIKSSKKCKIVGLKALPIVIPSTARAGAEKSFGEARESLGKRLAIAMATIEPKSHGKGTSRNEKSIAPKTPIKRDIATGKKRLSHIIEFHSNGFISVKNSIFFFIKNN